MGVVGRVNPSNDVLDEDLYSLGNLSKFGKLGRPNVTFRPRENRK